MKIRMAFVFYVLIVTTPLSVNTQQITTDAVNRSNITNLPPPLPPWKEYAVNIGSMIPYPEDDICIHASMKMAFEDVNKIDKLIAYVGNTSGDVPEFVREHYKLKPFYRDVSRTNMSDAIHKLHATYMKGPIMTAILGPPYKEITNNFIEYSSVLGNTQISYTDVNEPLEPYYVFFTQTPPSIKYQFKAAAALMDRFRWTRFGIIYDFSDPKYRKNSGELKESILLYSEHRDKTDILTEQGIWSQVLDPQIIKNKMDILQHNDRRIIMSLIGVRGARLVFCEAYHRKMYKPKVVWVMFEKLEEGWAKPLEDGTKDVDCTENELLTAADGHIYIVKQDVRKDNVPSISGMSGQEFTKRLRSIVGSNRKCSDDVAYAYDAVWVLAKGYQALAKKIWLRTYEYYGYSFSYMFSDGLANLKFEGVTGPVEFVDFDQTIYKRKGQIGIWAYKKNGKDKYLGVHHTNKSLLELIPNVTHVVFDSSTAPKDKAQFSYKFANFEKPLWITMWLVAFFGILIALVFFATIIVFSKERCHKMGSPILNSVIVLGGILCYISVIVYSVDTRLVLEGKIPHICFTFLCTLSIGFTMTFGGLFAKTWGLYKAYITPPVVNNQTEIKVRHMEFTIIVTSFSFYY